MLRNVLIVVAISFFMTGCNGQTKKEDNQSKTDKNKPQVSINVKRQFDKNGNLEKFDSTYSSFYSNVRNDTLLRDSILKNFKDTFNQKYSFSKEPFFNDFFFQDSSFNNDFYKKDFFINRFRENMKHMDNLFLGMDSLKNDFFERQFKMPGELTVPKRPSDSKK